MPVPFDEKVVVKRFPDEPKYNGISLKLNPLNFRDPNVFKGLAVTTT